MKGDGRAIRHRDANGNFAPIPEEDRPPIEELRRLYVDEGLTLVEVGERVGYSGATVGRWLTEAGVPMRPTALLPSEHGREGAWRKVVGKTEKPYDRLPDGTVLTVTFDVLECGHIKRVPLPKTGTRRTGNVRQESLPAKERRCSICERSDQP